MFKSLRNNFLILNLVTTSIMMLLAFMSIYIVTYNNTHYEIARELHKVSEINFKSNDSIKERSNLPPPPDAEANPTMQKRSISFDIVLDHAWDIVDTRSIFDMDDHFYENVKESALNQYKAQGQFKLDDTYWAFIIKAHPSGYKVSFLDITFQQNILNKMIYTFLIVAGVTLIVIFFISRSFANRAILPIKEAFEKQKQFIADASHELKTPLAVINTNIDVLLSNTSQTLGTEAKWLYYIKSEAERMSTLTNDLLYLTQVDYSEIQTIFNTFNISEATENVILTMEAILFENNIEFEYNITPNLFVLGNVEQIKQVIMILLDNAIKYVNPKGSIKVSLEKQHHAVMLSVTNTGDGIKQEDLARIFDRFYRVDKSRSRDSGGHGLGLAIAKTILTQHQGNINVTSVLHDYTTFSVELPCIS